MEKKEFTKAHSLELKGIAIIMMMFHHCFWGAGLFNNFDVSFAPFGQEFVVNMSLFFKICVSIFAFITGYGLILSLKKLNEKYEWTKREIFKWNICRIIKTLSGFWIIAIFAYIICQFVDGRTGTVFFNNKPPLLGGTQILANFFGLSNLFHLDNFCSAWWYMSIAILFIIVIPIFARLFKKYGYFLVFAIVVALPRVFELQFENSSFISFLTPVLLGMYCADKNVIVRFANYKIIKNNIIWNKIIKLVIETGIVIFASFLFIQLPKNNFYEITYGIIPICFIVYLYEFYLDLPLIKQVLKFLGKHAMNIFLIHEFIRTYYLNEYIYSFKNFIKIAMMLLLISLLISVVLELFKKLIRYDRWISKLIDVIDKRIKE